MNYTEIKDAVKTYSDRTDIDTVLDTFLRIVESRINRAVRVGNMSTRSVVATEADQAFYGLPTLFAGMRDIEIHGNDETKGQTGIYLSPEQMNEKQTDDGCFYYTIIADQLQIYPPQDDKVIQLIYYKRLEPLTSDATTNWVTERYPDIYVFGLMVEVLSYVKNAEIANLWNQRFQAMVSELTAEDSVDRWSGTALTIKAG